MHTVLQARDLSVVIPTYNRGDVLPRALESLVSQDLDPDRHEIVVVDNNSTDHTRAAVEAFVGRTPRDAVWDALRGHFADMGGKGRMPWLVRSVLAWHPYPWIWLLQGRYRDLIAEIGARMRKRRRR